MTMISLRFTKMPTTPIVKRAAETASIVFNAQCASMVTAPVLV
jgi:hypothetical protein